MRFLSLHWVLSVLGFSEIRGFTSVFLRWFYFGLNNII